MYTKMCTVLFCCCCNYIIFVLCEYDSTGKHYVKGCDSNFEVHVYIFKMLKVVRNETTTLH